MISFGNVQINLSDLIAAIALLLSLTLACLEISRRLSKLHFKVTNLTLIDVVDNKIGLLLHLTIMNPSMLTRTVYKMDFEPLDGYQIKQIGGIQDFEKALVTFRPFGDIGKAILTRLDDVAGFPLDIEPHHSRTVYIAMTISPIPRPLSVELSKKPILHMFGYLVGFDYKDKPIAKLLIELPL